MKQVGPAEREFLPEILALQNQFVSQDQLLSGFRIGTADKSQTLADVLIDCQALGPTVSPVLEALADAHIQASNNRAQESLASVPPVGREVGFELQQRDDDDVSRSISGIRNMALSNEKESAVEANSARTLSLTMGQVEASDLVDGVDSRFGAIVDDAFFVEAMLQAEVLKLKIRFQRPSEEQLIPNSEGEHQMPSVRQIPELSNG